MFFWVRSPQGVCSPFCSLLCHPRISLPTPGAEESRLEGKLQSLVMFAPKVL